MKISGAKFVGSFPSHKLAPKSRLPEIAFGGRSNVGKSSLINSLLGQRKLAQVSKSPGKTRLLNYFLVTGERDKELFHFVDLPGFGYAKVSVTERKSWKEMIENYVENSEKLMGFILLVDSRRGPEDEEMELIKYLGIHKRPVCLILTKADKLTKQESAQVSRLAESILDKSDGNNSRPILHSSVKKTGNDQIWRWILERTKDEGK